MNVSNRSSILPDLSAYIGGEGGEFPISVRDQTAARPDNFATNYHWHPDLQIMYIKSGNLEYFINGHTVNLKKGQGLFINSRRLHYIVSEQSQNTAYVCLRVHPCAFTLDSMVGVSYYERKFGLNNVDYIVFDHAEEWQNEAIKMTAIIETLFEDSAANVLPIIIETVRLVELIGSHITDMAQEDNNNQDQLVFLNMAQFIREHFKEKLRIEDISNAGHVSRAKTYSLFDRYAHMSPNTYIMNYRLSRAIVLLRDSNLSIAEISAICGFQSSSYFTSVFSKEKGMTPRGYRVYIKNLTHE